MAVGTIDQALLGAIRVRHAHLRAAAICRSLLVIDEVHASDEYMTKLTLNLARLFRRVGGQVLLLSATLGGAARQRYLQVFTGGRLRPSFDECLATPYPCVTTLDGVLPVPDDRPLSHRKPPVRIIPESIQDDARAVASLAAELAGSGGRILVLRNCVATARETQAALEELLVPGAIFSVQGVACPHHSRYAPGDRALLDAAVEAWFGSASDRQDGVLVSTQTLEQSLDVDFDVLVTDLCPMDVLLQRIGRLFRHLRRNPLRPAAHALPRCYVLTPRTFGPEALRHGRRHQYGRERAYENILAVMTTWERIRDMDAAGQLLVVPDMCRKLVETALHPDMLEKAAGRHGMVEERNALLGRTGAKSQAAAIAGVD
jgi:CRISPR-associated endonuclease/helicase Cas3